jgi:hypothetical protein
MSISRSSPRHSFAGCRSPCPHLPHRPRSLSRSGVPVGIPVAPRSREPAAPRPYEYATGEGQDVRVTVVIKIVVSVQHGVLPDGTLLVRAQGRHSRHRQRVLDPKPIVGPQVTTGESGPGRHPRLHGSVLHPQFAERSSSI